MLYRRCVWGADCTSVTLVPAGWACKVSCDFPLPVMKRKHKQLGPPIASMEAYWRYANMTLTCTESFFFLMNVVFCTRFIERSWCARLRRKLSASSNLEMWSGQWQFSTRITRQFEDIQIRNYRRSFLKPSWLFLSKIQLSRWLLGWKL